MTNQEMVAAILQAIQTESNLVILLQIMIANNINNLIPSDGSTSPQLLAACNALGIQTT